MKIHRFYIEEEIKENTQFKSVDIDLIHQLRDVFRMKKGESVILFNQNSFEFSADIELLTRREVIFNVSAGEYKPEKSKKKIHLFISIINELSTLI